VKVIFSENAERDLEDITDWIARDNPERARSFVADLVRTCKSIGRAPRSYPLVDKSRDPTLRRRIYRSYLIFFDIGPKEVEVLHVVHGARDYAQIVFANDEPGGL
jgi:toxin ParE1/3/4